MFPVLICLAMYFFIVVGDPWLGFSFAFLALANLPMKSD